MKVTEFLTALFYLAFNSWTQIAVISPLIIYLCYLYPRPALIAIISYYVYIHFINPLHFKDGSPWTLFTRQWPVMILHRWYHRMQLHIAPQLSSLINDTPPDKKPPQFIFGCHPHGLTAFWRAQMDALIYDHFTHPQFEWRVLCATALFYIPIVREMTLWAHYVDAGRRTAARNLRNGKSLFIVIGGEAEQLLSEYGKEQVYLKNRKGFVRLALSNNAGLVPTYAFGVSNNYTIIKWFQSLRWKIMELTRISLILGYGFCFSFMPYRTKFDMVFGAPITFDSSDVESFKECENKKDRNGMSQIIDKYHDLYMQQLQLLFDDNKDKYGFSDRQLTIV